MQYLAGAIGQVRAKVSARAHIATVDFKRDQTGAFISASLETDVKQFSYAVKDGVDSVRDLLMGQATGDRRTVISKRGHKVLPTCFKVDIGAVGANANADDDDHRYAPMFTYKRYYKQYEMICQDGVHSFIGTRIGRLIGP